MNQFQNRRSSASRSGPFTLIDLFAGGGGMTLGFLSEPGRFRVVWANDSDPAAVATYNRNFGDHCKYGRIEEVLEDSGTKIPLAEVVIGGPPCQGFSLLNKKRTGEESRHLWRPFLDVVRCANASLFVMENVPQVLKSPEFAEFRAEAGDMGFTIWADRLCAADYGVPQLRWRAFVVGCTFADPAIVFPPQATHSNCDHPVLPLGNGTVPGEQVATKPWRTVHDAIADLPEPEGTEIRHDTPPPLNLHFGRRPTPLSLKRYQIIPGEGEDRVQLHERAPELTLECWKRNWSGGTDVFGRLWWKKPAYTIRTEFYKPEKGRYLHPCRHRPLTHREAARLQTFPDMFRFEGKKIEIARQIGNAVPPMLAARVADCIYRLLVMRESYRCPTCSHPKSAVASCRGYEVGTLSPS
jgi:DNA (cytosine-5)-methyltransferase 1